MMSPNNPCHQRAEEDDSDGGRFSGSAVSTPSLRVKKGTFPGNNRRLQLGTELGDRNNITTFGRNAQIRSRSSSNSCASVYPPTPKLRTSTLGDEPTAVCNFDSSNCDIVLSSGTSVAAIMESPRTATRISSAA